MIAVGPQAIEIGALVAAVSDDRFGGVCTFLGTTRETSPEDVRPVEALDYEAYVEMAEAELTAIADEAQARFGPLAIAIVHRTGRVALQEASVGVAVGAPHRGAAFDACRYAIDALKARAPIWKRERYRDGDGAWIANAESKTTAMERAQQHADAEGGHDVVASSDRGPRAEGAGGAQPGAERR